MTGEGASGEDARESGGSRVSFEGSAREEERQHRLQGKLLVSVLLPPAPSHFFFFFFFLTLTDPLRIQPWSQDRHINKNTQTVETN